MLLDRFAGGVVGRKLERALPSLGRFVAETCFLVEDREILQRSKMAGVDLDCRLELVDRLVHLTLFSVKQPEMKMQTVSERVDVDATLQVLDRFVESPGFVSGHSGF